jgi:Uma2 family endonuclease
MAEKRDDYFAAGTQVVWDVDTQSECIHVFKVADPKRRLTDRHGEFAEAEPAVPGWRVSVDWIFA